MRSTTQKTHQTTAYPARRRASLSSRLLLLLLLWLPTPTSQIPYNLSNEVACASTMRAPSPM